MPDTTPDQPAGYAGGKVRELNLGVDLGGTKIEVAVLAGDGRIVARERAPTPADDYALVLAAITALVEKVEGSLDVRQLPTGVCGPGSISPSTGLIRNANLNCLNGKPLDRDLAQALERPLRYANDADCLALSEAIDGVAAGAETVFGVILGTGVGGAVVVRGALIGGANAIAGEWGHNPLPEWGDSPRHHCWCGLDGCIETYLSGPSLEKDYRVSGGKPGLSVQAIARLAERGDSVAEVVLARYERRLGHALAGVINLLDPDVIVLGGGVSNLDRLYRRVPAVWPQAVFSDIVRTQLRQARFGDSSGVRGAARLWKPAADD